MDEKKEAPCRFLPFAGQPPIFPLFECLSFLPENGYAGHSGKSPCFRPHFPANIRPGSGPIIRFPGLFL
ncbi:MAG: hypothetical protein BAA03_08130 [Caldibacillus debilis]|nr:MAG: hypothetical protein BAA03_08130 [Caldibacillus debilis]